MYQHNMKCHMYDTSVLKKFEVSGKNLHYKLKFHICACNHVCVCVFVCASALV